MDLQGQLMFLTHVNVQTVQNGRAAAESVKFHAVHFVGVLAMIVKIQLMTINCFLITVVQYIL